MLVWFEAKRGGAVLDLTVAELKKKLQEASAEEFSALERALVADTRKGVLSALEVARRRLEGEAREAERLARMYSFEEDLLHARGAGCAVGLDEVGRGPLAGPLAVGAVVLDPDCRIAGLNDSKQIRPEVRVEMAEEIKARALAWSVQYVSPRDMDSAGMTASLVTAFRRAVAAVEDQGVKPDVVLLDGNPLHLDAREVNVVKGDASCASIAAASVVAKVERDALMCAYADEFPEYGFAANKGYASAEHIEAIKRFGLSPIHRESFCTSFVQPTLF